MTVLRLEQWNGPAALLGNVYQVLAARGVDVDSEAPWIRPWFLRYQMPDGGLNCDNEAYLVKDECPSSMVGTIAAFEAVLLYTKRDWTAEEHSFIDRAAQFLLDRELRIGSQTKHNAAEQDSAKDWTKLCFPRFYFYDVLRGLSAISIWAQKTGRTLPDEKLRTVIDDLTQRFSADGIYPQRLAFHEVKTIQEAPNGEWLRGQIASTFPLLDAVSAVGVANPFLTREWQNAKRQLKVVARPL